MSLQKLIELNAWVRNNLQHPSLVTAQKSIEKMHEAGKLYEQSLLIKFSLPMDIIRLVDQINNSVKQIKQSDFRQSMERFTVDEIQEFELIETKANEDASSNVMLSQTQQMRQLISDIYKNNEALYILTGRKFEELIAELLSDQGFDVQLTQQTRDGCYDILAIQKLLGQFSLKFLVECKKYDSSRKVDVEVVRSFSHVVSKQGANKGILVTTSYFTKDALKEEQNPYLLDFRDKDQVLEWVDAYLKK